MKYFILIAIYLFSIKSIGQNDTLNLYYDIGIYKLNKKNYKKIQSKLENLNEGKKYHVAIISSCDFLGTKNNNFELSYKRAVTVKKLIDLKENVTISSITYKGIGEIHPRNRIKTARGFTSDRKTMLIFKDETQIVLDKIKNSKKGEIYVLRDIIFEPGRHMLKKESMLTVKRLLKVLKENPKLEIELSGHVCCGKNKSDIMDGYDKDSKSYNLSENRAKHIYKYLVLKKIDPKRLSHKGYGFQRPLYYPELTEQDKKMNRRVEIKVVNN